MQSTRSPFVVLVAFACVLAVGLLVTQKRPQRHLSQKQTAMAVQESELEFLIPSVPNKAAFGNDLGAFLHFAHQESETWYESKTDVRLDAIIPKIPEGPPFPSPGRAVEVDVYVAAFSKLYREDHKQRASSGYPCFVGIIVGRSDGMTFEFRPPEREILAQLDEYQDIKGRAHVLRRIDGYFDKTTGEKGVEYFVEIIRWGQSRRSIC